MAMMLPHVVELRKWMDQDNYTERPELNEWDLQAIQEELEYKQMLCLLRTVKTG